MKKHPIIWLLGQARRRLGAVLVLITAQVVNALLGVYFALGSRGVIDSAVAGDMQGFYRACVTQALIIAGTLLTLTLMRHMRDQLRAVLERDWKQRLLRGLLHGEYADVSAYHSAELLNRLNNDVAKVNEGILSVFPAAAAMVARLVASVAVLGALDGTFTLIVLCLGAVILVSTALMRRRLKELNKKVSHHDGLVSAFLQEIMEKLLMVQAMDVSQEVERRSDDLLDQRYVLQRKRKNVSLLTNTGISLMSYGSGFFALCWCAWRMLAGQMTFGGLTAVVHLVGQLQAPFVNLSGVMPQYIAMLASGERLMELEAIQGQKAPAGEDPHVLYDRMESISAENLSFSYDRDPVLHGAEFDLPKGAFASITGPSGIGKSTLLKLLLGIFKPESGGLFLQCGAERIPLDRATRRLFAYVPQGNLLLSGTLLENLTIARPDATREEIEEALFVSAMEDYLPQLPDGLNTVIGESAAGLSEGQAQRLAIARAVLGGAPILLLDECTSALDPETEKKVLSRIRNLPDRTCIAVTHRNAAVELCDWQLQLENGGIRAVQR